MTPAVARGAFERRARLVRSTPELDAQERDWWNRHAGLMEEIWTLPLGVSRLLRAELGRVAAEFFERGSILEPGCGTGWPGRLIARALPGTRVTGVDISSEQIHLAVQHAAEEGLGDVCTYREGDMAALDLAEFDGAFFHAALHHLADDEVEALLAKLATAPPGFKVVFYEPVFVEGIPRLPRALAKFACAAIGRVAARLLRVAGDEGSRLETRVQELADEASANGWFLSPKEVPFDERSLLRSLSRRFDVVFARPLHFTAVEAAQRLAMASDRDLSVLRRALRVDRLLLRTGLYRVCPGRYAFWLIAVRTASMNDGSLSS